MLYLHKEDPRSIYVLNSEAKSQGLQIAYKVKCQELVDIFSVNYFITIFRTIFIVTLTISRTVFISTFH